MVLLHLWRKVCCRFLSLLKSHRPRTGLNQQTLGPMASMITIKPPRTTKFNINLPILGSQWFTTMNRTKEIQHALETSIALSREKIQDPNMYYQGNGNECNLYNFHSFRCLKIFKECWFQSYTEVEKARHKWFYQKTAGFFEKGIQCLPIGWFSQFLW
jgi:hypothetical protein